MVCQIVSPNHSILTFLVHMSDIIGGRSLDDFVGIAACGGFSYGDVLGAGNGWAKSILMHSDNARPEFQKFFQRTDTFTIGICNGCQMLARLKELIPGTDHWPLFVENKVSRISICFTLR